jgi:hypothetical protein
MDQGLIVGTKGTSGTNAAIEGGFITEPIWFPNFRVSNSFYLFKPSIHYAENAWTNPRILKKTKIG